MEQTPKNPATPMTTASDGQLLVYPATALRMALQ